MGVVRSVGGESTNHVDTPGQLEHLLEDLDRSLAVVVPAQPARMGRIKVDADVGQGREPLDRVGRQFHVGIARVDACGKVHVGGQVGQGIRFHNRHNGQLGVGLEKGHDALDVLGPVARGPVLFQSQLPRGGFCGTVAVRHVVDHEDRQGRLAAGLLLLSRFVEPLWYEFDVGDGVEPQPARVLLDLANDVCVRRKQPGCCLDVLDILGVDEEVDAQEGIAARGLGPGRVSAAGRGSRGTLAQAGAAGREDERN